MLVFISNLFLYSIYVWTRVSECIYVYSYLFLYTFKLLYLPYPFLKYIRIIIEFAKQRYNTYTIRRKERDNTIIKPRLNRRIVKIEVRIQDDELTKLHRRDVFLYDSNLIDL